MRHMRWATLFHLHSAHHAQTLAAPPPFERVELMQTGGAHGADVGDIPHAVADLLTHAVDFVSVGTPRVEHADDFAVWLFMLELPTGSAPVRGHPCTEGKPGPETDVRARAVTVQGTREFACGVAQAVEAMRIVPGLMAHLVGQRADLLATRARAERAEAIVQNLDDCSGD